MGTSRILVVDDDEITRSFLTDILNHSGYEVIPAENGRKALESMEKSTPDLILSDVLMPELSGFELFRKVQENEQLQDVPFIFLTSLDDGDALINLQELGPDDYMSKPVQSRHLLATVKGKLKRKQRRLEQVGRERDKMRDRIRWTLSHELRTPLTIIQGISELLLNEQQGPHTTDYNELLQSLRSQSFQLGTLIENFLLVSRIESGVEELSWRQGAELVSTVEAIEEAAFPWWERTRSRGLKFEVDAPDSLPAVYVHRPHLLEVLRQILDNAFKFADPENPVITMRGFPTREGVGVVVTDNGRGISSSQQALIFQKLSQVDREIQEQQGSGLGLFISKRLMDLNGGAISLRSEPGQGTEVEITLPSGPAAGK